MKKRRLNADNFSMMIENRGNGLNAAESAKIIGCDASSVSKILRLYDYVRMKNTDEICAMIRSECVSIEAVEWCAMRNNYKLDSQVYETYYSALERRRKSRQEITAVNSAMPVANDAKPVVDDHPTNEDTFFVRIIELQMQQTEFQQKILLELQAMSNSIRGIEKQAIPEATREAKKSINENADMLNATLLDIRQNTRKR